MRRVGCVINNAVEQRAQADLRQAGNGEDRTELAVGDCLVDVWHDVRFFQRALFEILFHQGIIGFSDQFDQSLPGFINQVAVFGGDVDLFGLAVGAQLISLHVHDIDDAAKIFFFADRQRKRNDGPAKSGLRAFERAAKVGVFLIELGNHHHARQDEFVGIGPGLFGLHFDALDGVNDDERTVGNAQRGARVGDKGRISRRVYKSDFGIAMILDERVRY